MNMEKFNSSKCSSMIANRTSKFPRLPFKTPYKWLDVRRNEDDAEGLWRIHDKLYDFTDFIEKHPGGSDWITFSKGIDITEHYEVHHLTSVPDAMLVKYFVRNASQPRNYRITFDENGFYKTLKRKVVARLKYVDRMKGSWTNFTSDTLLISLFVFAILAAKFNNTLLTVLAGTILCLNTIAAHNFIHMKDNFRMYYYNFSLLNYKDARIFHAMSHHLYPNSVYDMEAYFYEPFFGWDQRMKSHYKKYLSAATYFLGQLVGIFYVAIGRYGTLMMRPELLTLDELIPFSLPLLMYFLGTADFQQVLKLWLLTILVASFLFNFIGNTSGHHFPGNFCEDEKFKFPSIDFGLLMIGTVTERTECKGSQFSALTLYGDHLYHHFFPTLDCSVLRHIDDLFLETCKEFNIETKKASWKNVTTGQFKQLINY